MVSKAMMLIEEEVFRKNIIKNNIDENVAILLVLVSIIPNDLCI